MKVIYKLLILTTLPGLILLTACISKEYPVTETYQETGYRTEMTTEPYTENQTSIQTDSGEFALPCYFNWHTITYHYYGYEIPNSSSYDNISLRLSIWPQLQYEPVMLRVFDMSKTGQIPSPEPLSSEDHSTAQPSWYFFTGSASATWLDTANKMMQQAKFIGATDYLWWRTYDPQIIVLKAGKPSSIAVIITGPQNTWNSRFNLDVIWSRNNTGYSYVTKQRQVSKQVPFQVERQRTVYKVKQVPFWETMLP